MGRQFDLGPGVSCALLRTEFVSGLACFKNNDMDAALTLFRAADECAEIDDVYQNRYTSFHGLVRVFKGDRNGVKLCRKAAVGETSDTEVYYNLALAENRLGERESALQALRRGLRIAPEHAGLLRLKTGIARHEQHGQVIGLARESWFNRVLGWVSRSAREPYPDR